LDGSEAEGERELRKGKDKKCGCMERRGDKSLGGIMLNLRSMARVANLYDMAW
jgi:hypothetical protein